MPEYTIPGDKFEKIVFALKQPATNPVLGGAAGKTAAQAAQDAKRSGASDECCKQLKATLEKLNATLTSAKQRRDAELVRIEKQISVSMERLDKSVIDAVEARMNAAIRDAQAEINKLRNIERERERKREQASTSGAPKATRMLEQVEESGNKLVDMFRSFGVQVTRAGDGIEDMTRQAQSLSIEVRDMIQAMRGATRVIRNRSGALGVAIGSSTAALALMNTQMSALADAMRDRADEMSSPLPDDGLASSKFNRRFRAFQADIMRATRALRQTVGALTDMAEVINRINVAHVTSASAPRRGLFDFLFGPSVTSPIPPPTPPPIPPPIPPTASAPGGPTPPPDPNRRDRRVLIEPPEPRGLGEWMHALSDLKKLGAVVFTAGPAGAMAKELAEASSQMGRSAGQVYGHLNDGNKLASSMVDKFIDVAKATGEAEPNIRAGVTALAEQNASLAASVKISEQLVQGARALNIDLVQAGNLTGQMREYLIGSTEDVIPEMLAQLAKTAKRFSLTGMNASIVALQIGKAVEGLRKLGPLTSRVTEQLFKLGAAARNLGLGDTMTGMLDKAKSFNQVMGNFTPFTSIMIGKMRQVGLSMDEALSGSWQRNAGTFRKGTQAMIDAMKTAQAQIAGMPEHTSQAILQMIFGEEMSPDELQRRIDAAEQSIESHSQRLERLQSLQKQAAAYEAQAGGGAAGKRLANDFLASRGIKGGQDELKMQLQMAQRHQEYEPALQALDILQRAQADAAKRSISLDEALAGIPEASGRSAAQLGKLVDTVPQSIQDELKAMGEQSRQSTVDQHEQAIQRGIEQSRDYLKDISDNMAEIYQTLNGAAFAQTAAHIASMASIWSFGLVAWSGMRYIRGVLGRVFGPPAAPTTGPAPSVPPISVPPASPRVPGSPPVPGSPLPPAPSRAAGRLSGTMNGMTRGLIGLTRASNTLLKATPSMLKAIGAVTLVGSAIGASLWVMSKIWPSAEQIWGLTKSIGASVPAFLMLSAELAGFGFAGKALLESSKYLGYVVAGVTAVAIGGTVIAYTLRKLVEHWPKPDQLEALTQSMRASWEPLGHIAGQLAAIGVFGLAFTLAASVTIPAVIAGLAAVAAGGLAIAKTLSFLNEKWPSVDVITGLSARVAAGSEALWSLTRVFGSVGLIGGAIVGTAGIGLASLATGLWTVAEYSPKIAGVIHAIAPAWRDITGGQIDSLTVSFNSASAMFGALGAAMVQVGRSGSMFGDAGMYFQDRRIATGLDALGKFAAGLAQKLRAIDLPPAKEIDVKVQLLQKTALVMNELGAAMDRTAKYGALWYNVGKRMKQARVESGIGFLAQFGEDLSRAIAGVKLPNERDILRITESLERSSAALSGLGVAADKVVPYGSRFGSLGQAIFGTQRQINSGLDALISFGVTLNAKLSELLGKLNPPNQNSQAAQNAQAIASSIAGMGASLVQIAEVAEKSGEWGSRLGSIGKWVKGTSRKIEGGAETLTDFASVVSRQVHMLLAGVDENPLPTAREMARVKEFADSLTPMMSIAQLAIKLGEMDEALKGGFMTRAAAAPGAAIEGAFSIIGDTIGGISRGIGGVASAVGGVVHGGEDANFIRRGLGSVISGIGGLFNWAGNTEDLNSNVRATNERTRRLTSGAQSLMDMARAMSTAMIGLRDSMPNMSKEEMDKLTKHLAASVETFARLSQSWEMFEKIGALKQDQKNQALGGVYYIGEMGKKIGVEIGNIASIAFFKNSTSRDVEAIAQSIEKTTESFMKVAAAHETLISIGKLSGAVEMQNGQQIVTGDKGAMVGGVKYLGMVVREMAAELDSIKQIPILKSPQEVKDVTFAILDVTKAFDAVIEFGKQQINTTQMAGGAERLLQVVMDGLAPFGQSGVLDEIKRRADTLRLIAQSLDDVRKAAKDVVGAQSEIDALMATNLGQGNNRTPHAGFNAAVPGPRTAAAQASVQPATAINTARMAAGNATPLDAKTARQLGLAGVAAAAPMFLPPSVAQQVSAAVVSSIAREEVDASGRLRRVSTAPTTERPANTSIPEPPSPLRQVKEGVRGVVLGPTSRAPEQGNSNIFSGSTAERPGIVSTSQSSLKSNADQTKPITDVLTASLGVQKGILDVLVKVHDLLNEDDAVDLAPRGGPTTYTIPGIGPAAQSLMSSRGSFSGLGGSPQSTGPFSDDTTGFSSEQGELPR